MKYMRGMTSCVLDVFHTLSLCFFRTNTCATEKMPKTAPILPNYQSFTLFTATI